MASDHEEPATHKGQWDAGAADEFGRVWWCDVDCPHPEHDDDPAPHVASNGGPDSAGVDDA